MIVNNDNVANRVWFEQVRSPSRITILIIWSAPIRQHCRREREPDQRYAQYMGARGYQVGAGGGTTLPNAPRNLRVTP